MKILIVDDKPAVRSSLMGILTQLGFTRVLQARDGLVAWDILNGPGENGGVDLVISDLEMPGMNGLELLRHIRSDARFSALPFIMATTVRDRDLILDIMKLGIQAYISKPFNHDMVEIKLKQAGLF
ncbi:MAG: response regulator [Desulfobacterales bacterium]|nr:response regulator [Desulfobacterales bacterium]